MIFSSHLRFNVVFDTLVIYVFSVHTTNALGISSDTLTTLPCFWLAFRKSAVIRLTEHSSMSNIPITSSFFTVESPPRNRYKAHTSVKQPFSARQDFPPFSADRSSILQQVINTWLLSILLMTKFLRTWSSSLRMSSRMITGQV